MICFILMSQINSAQLSTKHFIPPLTSASFGNANPENQFLYISTPNTNSVVYTIKPIGLPETSYITGEVTNTNPQNIFLGSGNGQLFISSNATSEITNKGYVVEASDVIYVSVRVQAGNSDQAGALVSKGNSSLGREFRVGSFTNQNPQSNYLNFVSVMATEDDTEIIFDDLPSDIIIKNYSGVLPVTITLDKFESYILATNSLDAIANRDGLIGCLVTSNKDIVVNSGSANGSFHNGFGRDYGIDQIVGASKIGSEYIFVRGDGLNGWENVLIIAHTDNTTVSINGNPPLVTLDAGEYHLIEGNNYSPNGNMYVETSEDVFAYQGVGATTSEANQGLFFVPPLSCEARGNLDNIAAIENIGSTLYSGGLSIVTTSTANVTINNLPLSNFNTSGPFNVMGNTNYVTYKVLGLTGNVSVQSDDELYSAYFNFNGAATSGSFYSGFPSAPEINFEPNFIALGNCIPNITLSATNIDNFDSFQWLFDDGSGFEDLNISNTSLMPQFSGTYKLVGIVECSGLILESPEIPISICPDDSDNDGIINNLDIDNDNDGILDCLESRGDVVLDISNTSQPLLLFEDGEINNLIATGEFLPSRVDTENTLFGSEVGNFISTISAGNNENNEYKLTFSESVNIKFTENSAVTHVITGGEYYTAKILPTDKNITLVNPDDRLLVDTNFDGEFESGVTSISGSEINFIINPSSSSNASFEFLANDVNGFSFIHHINNSTSNSVFNGNIQLKCYALDSDLDGFNDALDLDSDNDGIPDFIESLGNNYIGLSGVDTDNNGLDDAYDINSTPIDSDLDGVSDYLDLDSDNDGIYDLFETGQLGLLSDTDFNGIVDGPIMNFGDNGWVDAAETSTDSGEIGYVLDDFDVDNNFSYLDLDSDGDECYDVKEAGFLDPNVDGILGDVPVSVDIYGVVNATDGYTFPNADYLNYAPISIDQEPENNSACENSDTMFSIVSNAADYFQWETSSNGIDWTAISNNAIFSGVTTNTLVISDVTLSLDSTLYRVRLNRDGNSCDFLSEEVILSVFPLPVINDVVELVQCDDDNDGFTPFNLNEANVLISNTAEDLSFSFYTDMQDAVDGDELSTNFITNSEAYINENVSNSSVWARVESQFGCASIARLDLRVSTTLIPASFQRVFTVCDDFLDENGNDNANNDDTDGISTFDFSSVTAEVLSLIPPGQNPLPPRYFRNEADALEEVNEITDISNYRNIGYPGTQQIYIRIDSAIANDCLGLGTHITLIVEELPVANPVSIDTVCDDDNDGMFPFDVSNVETTVLGSQSVSDVIIEYFDENSNPLPSPLPNPFVTHSQTISIRVSNIISNSQDGPCFDETSLTFEIFDSPTAHPVFIAPVCDIDGTEDGMFNFDTSSIEDQLLMGQQGMSIRYFFSDGTLLGSVLPNPFFSGTQTITAEVYNPLNEDCTDSTLLNFEVNPLPDFIVETPQIVCSSNPNFSIDLEPIPLDNEDYSYEWFYEDGLLLSTDLTLTVSTPGTYTIKLTNDVTGCFRSKDIFVNASEIATITLEDIIINDLSDNNSIEIIVSNNNLGLGNYEFALGNEFFFQDEPFFDNIPPGIHTLYVRDKDGCGTVSIDIPIIGYPKFFTPNGDGTNDTWQIKGINRMFQPQSIIYIYDRYGKLIKQLSPIDEGWDGTFNGNRLPSNDYWFSVALEDGRQFSGHFTLKR